VTQAARKTPNPNLDKPPASYIRLITRFCHPTPPYLSLKSPRRSDQPSVGVLKFPNHTSPSNPPMSYHQITCTSHISHWFLTCDNRDIVSDTAMIRTAVIRMRGYRRKATWEGRREMSAVFFGSFLVENCMYLFYNFYRSYHTKR